MSTFKQTSFIGGIDLISSETEIAENAYRWGVNIRQRLGKPQPIKRNLRIDTIPAGKKQGLVSAGNVLIAFVNGRAYYNVDGTNPWIQIPDFSMDTIVDRYYAIAVPSSTFNLLRKADSSGSANAPINAAVTTRVSGTPAGILVQDGVNQPWIIIWDEVNNFFYARVTKNWNEWSNDTALDREYVPIGNRMFIQSQILFIEARDGKSVYRSITGRPLDFMINVDTNGNKATSESIGGAASVSFAFDFDNITCLAAINTPDSFIYGTASVLRVIVFDNVNLIFGEPRFSVSSKIEAGVVNQDSIVDVLSDLAFVDFEAITSFDAVKQLKFEGKNTIFSLMLAGLLKDVKQTSPCCIAFDNFGLFNINTIWGRLTAVFDMLQQKWVSLDITELGYITQYCIVVTPSQTKLYAINNQDELFLVYGDAERNTGQIMTRAWVEGDSRSETKTETLRVILDAGVTGAATFRIREYIDSAKGQVDHRNLPVITAGILFPISFPIIFDSKPTTNNEAFTLDNGTAGSKLQFHLQWDNDASMREYEIVTHDITADAALEQSQLAITNTP